MSNPTDRAAIKDVSTYCERRVEGNDLFAQVNLIDVISDMRGWLPLIVEEKMIVHFGGKEYEIKRKT